MLSSESYVENQRCTVLTWSLCILMHVSLSSPMAIGNHDDVTSSFLPADGSTIAEDSDSRLSEDVNKIPAQAFLRVFSLEPRDGLDTSTTATFSSPQLSEELTIRTTETPTAILVTHSVVENENKNKNFGNYRIYAVNGSETRTGLDDQQLSNINDNQTDQRNFFAGNRYTADEHHLIYPGIPNFLGSEAPITIAHRDETNMRSFQLPPEGYSEREFIPANSIADFGGLPQLILATAQDTEYETYKVPVVSYTDFVVGDSIAPLTNRNNQSNSSIESQALQMTYKTGHGRDNGQQYPIGLRKIERLQQTADETSNRTVTGETNEYHTEKMGNIELDSFNENSLADNYTVSSDDSVEEEMGSGIEGRQAKNSEYYENYEYQTSANDDLEVDKSTDDVVEEVKVINQGRQSSKKQVKKKFKKPVEPVGHVQAGSNRGKKRKTNTASSKRRAGNANRKQKVVNPSSSSRPVSGSALPSTAFVQSPGQPPIIGIGGGELSIQQPQQPFQHHSASLIQQQHPSVHQQIHEQQITPGSDGSAVLLVPAGPEFNPGLGSHQHNLNFIDPATGQFIGASVSGGPFPPFARARQGDSSVDVDRNGPHHSLGTNGNQNIARDGLPEVAPFMQPFGSIDGFGSQPIAPTGDFTNINQGHFVVPGNAPIMQLDTLRGAAPVQGFSNQSPGGTMTAGQKDDVTAGNDENQPLSSSKGVEATTKKTRRSSKQRKQKTKGNLKEDSNVSETKDSNPGKDDNETDNNDGEDDDAATATAAGGAYDWSQIKTGFEDYSGDDNGTDQQQDSAIDANEEESQGKSANEAGNDDDEEDEDEKNTEEDENDEPSEKLKGRRLAADKSVALTTPYNPPAMLGSPSVQEIITEKKQKRVAVAKSKDIVTTAAASAKIDDGNGDQSTSASGQKLEKSDESDKSTEKSDNLPANRKPTTSQSAALRVTKTEAAESAIVSPSKTDEIKRENSPNGSTSNSVSVAEATTKRFVGSETAGTTLPRMI